MTGVLVITMMGATAAGGRHVSERESHRSWLPAALGGGSSFSLLTGSAQSSRSETCHAHKAVKFYARRLNEHRARMGAPHALAAAKRPGCPRYLAHVLQRKAGAWRLRADRWVAYHYHWWVWLPAKHRRVGACETGYGREPGDFTWDSGTYVSFAGIYRPGYDDDAHRVGNLGWDETKRELGRLPTPREQMQAVDSHRAAHGGWSGWGCRGA